MSILIIDNYDSFTYNLFHLVEKLSNEDVVVKRNDQCSVDEVSNYSALIISPGPGLPVDAGITLETIRQYGSTKKILGVCLGHQAIAEAFGGTLRNLKKVKHGISTPAHRLLDDELFQDIPTQFVIGHYHSWVVEEPLPPNFLVTARDAEGEVMAMKHTSYNLRSVQFHPESVLTPFGETMIANWLKIKN